MRGLSANVRTFRHPVSVAAAVVAALVVTIGVAGSAPAGPNRPPYLALGDSAVFGYIASDGVAYRNPANFVAYPDYVGRALHLTTVNASCPGEATAGFLSATGTDNGCRPYKFVYPLHVDYAGTQMAFATSYLRSHPATRLVTLGIGANDAFVLENRCGDDLSCIAKGLPALLASVGSNVDTILGGIRAAGFHGVLVVVNYYSLDYTDAMLTSVVGLLNDTLAARAHAHGAVVADVFTAFKQAASTSYAGGETCKTALLNADPSHPFAECDVHPSQSGHMLIAKAVAHAYAVATGS